VTNGVMPGLIWRPIDYSKHRAVDELTAHTLHEAVTRAEQSVYGWVYGEGSCNWFNGKNGYAEQYIPAGVESYANSSGNHRSFAMESYDGLQILQNPYREVGIGGVYGDSAQTGRWDAGQCERAADVTAWLHLEYGLPLQVMQTSHTSEHGVGPHRLGVPGWPPYDENGGELWTSHPGKTCPGDLRIAQIPSIVARAQVIADAIQAGRCGYLPTGEVDVQAALARTDSTPQPEEDVMASLEEVLNGVRQLVREELDARLGKDGKEVKDTHIETTRIRAGLQHTGGIQFPGDEELRTKYGTK
jgi:hypothetical protein